MKKKGGGVTNKDLYIFSLEYCMKSSFPNSLFSEVYSVIDDEGKKKFKKRDNALV